METQVSLQNVASILNVNYEAEKNNFKIYSFEIMGENLEYITHESEYRFFDIFQIIDGLPQQVQKSYLKLVDTKTSHLMGWNLREEKYQIIFSDDDGTPFFNSFLMREPHTNLGRLIIFYDCQILEDYMGSVKKISETGIQMDSRLWEAYEDFFGILFWGAAEIQEKAMAQKVIKIPFWKIIFQKLGWIS